jgi:deoxyribodipyrimidine photo-lyase
MAPTTDKADRPALVLFRHDLRIADNRALLAAAASERPVIAAFVLDEESPDTRPIGGARRWWLHHSLLALAASLSKLGIELCLRRGEMAKVASDIARESDAEFIFWNRRYDPPAIEADKKMKSALEEIGVRCESFEGHLLHEPWRIKTGSGNHYRVYSPFWRAFVEAGEPREPLPAPKSLRAWTGTLASDSLDDWNLLPTKPDWAGGLRQAWTPGEAGAHEALDAFVEGAINGYGENRDFPAKVTTSRLSPYLCHGEVTPFQAWHAVGATAANPRDVEKFRKELAWREFSWHLLFHNPTLSTENFNGDFGRFPWQRNEKSLKAWQTGNTGYPIVDAGMRELWQTGWMHNRVRMVVASFLVKHLLIDWREGEEWFWDTLVDADPGNNPASWQWVAGSGADAAPYFRIFNPILQGEKFDPEGNYVARFVPEISRLDARRIHQPWSASRLELSAAGVKLGDDYAVPVIEHQHARDRALAAYKEIKGSE